MRGWKTGQRLLTFGGKIWIVLKRRKCNLFYRLQSAYSFSKSTKGVFNLQNERHLRTRYHMVHWQGSYLMLMDLWITQILRMRLSVILWHFGSVACFLYQYNCLPQYIEILLLNTHYLTQPKNGKESYLTCMPL